MHQLLTCSKRILSFFYSEWNYSILFMYHSKHLGLKESSFPYQTVFCFFTSHILSTIRTTFWTSVSDFPKYVIRKFFCFKRDLRIKRDFLFQRDPPMAGSSVQLLQRQWVQNVWFDLKQWWNKSQMQYDFLCCFYVFWHSLMLVCKWILLI